MTVRALLVTPLVVRPGAGRAAQEVPVGARPSAERLRLRDRRGRGGTRRSGLVLRVAFRALAVALRVGPAAFLAPPDPVRLEPRPGGQAAQRRAPPYEGVNTVWGVTRVGRHPGDHLL